jgi:hypothetical protein
MSSYGLATSGHCAFRIRVTEKCNLYVSGLDFTSKGSVQGFPAFEHCTTSDAFLIVKT